MAVNPTYPGVYIQEIPSFPPSVAPVATAIPGFIGYTEKAIERQENDLLNKPKKIDSLNEYVQCYGTGIKETGIEVAEVNGQMVASITGPSQHNMYYALRAYFENGGGPCYIVSVGNLTEAVNKDKLKDGLDVTEQVDEITLLVFPESHALVSYTGNDGPNFSLYGNLMANALDSCKKLGDRFAIMDVPPDIPLTKIPRDKKNTDGTDAPQEDVDDAATLFRDSIGINNLLYGASYIPNLETTFSFLYEEKNVNVKKADNSTIKLEDINPNGKLQADGTRVKNDNADAALYAQSVQAISFLPVVLPAGPFMAGIYARVDRTRGVWKAPANVSLNGVVRPSVLIDDATQGDILNISDTGKSINAIREFAGRGVLAWGARTLAGNDNEWRYVSVRRFFNFVEESVKKATIPFVFEPNDRNTWTRVRGLIENFLVIQWRAGALAGAVPEEAFFVRVGLPETMTAQDILEGRMNVEIGMAVVRPAEFIILKFSHIMQTS